MVVGWNIVAMLRGTSRSSEEWEPCVIIVQLQRKPCPVRGYSLLDMKGMRIGMASCNMTHTKMAARCHRLTRADGASLIIRMIQAMTEASSSMGIKSASEPIIVSGNALARRDST